LGIIVDMVRVHRNTTKMFLKVFQYKATIYFANNQLQSAQVQPLSFVSTCLASTKISVKAAQYNASLASASSFHLSHLGQDIREGRPVQCWIWKAVLAKHRLRQELQPQRQPQPAFAECWRCYHGCQASKLGSIFTGSVFVVAGCSSATTSLRTMAFSRRRESAMTTFHPPRALPLIISC
jgi:hypothetical protein